MSENKKKPSTMKQAGLIAAAGALSLALGSVVHSELSKDNAKDSDHITITAAQKTMLIDKVVAQYAGGEGFDRYKNFFEPPKFFKYINEGLITPEQADDLTTALKTRLEDVPIEKFEDIVNKTARDAFGARPELIRASLDGNKAGFSDYKLENATRTLIQNTDRHIIGTYTPYMNIDINFVHDRYNCLVKFNDESQIRSNQR